MTTRCCCFNCGFVDDYELPYHAKVYEYHQDTVPAPEGSRIELDDGMARPLICANCGWNMLQVVYWSTSKAKLEDPVAEIRLARQLT